MGSVLLARAVIGGGYPAGMFRILFGVSLLIFATPAMAEEVDSSVGTDEAIEAKEAELNFEVNSGHSSSDHTKTVGNWGFQVAAIEAGIVPGVGTLPFVGVRKWTSADQGFEGGVALSFNHDGQTTPLSDTSVISLGVTAGWLRALSVHKHLTVFWEPQGTLIVVLPDDDSGGENGFVFDGRVNVGGELRLGMIGLPEIGLTTKISGGLRVSHDGETDFFLGTFGGAANSIRGLLQTSVGFVLYL